MTNDEALASLGPSIKVGLNLISLTCQEQLQPLEKRPDPHSSARKVNKMFEFNDSAIEHGRQDIEGLSPSVKAYRYSGMDDFCQEHSDK
jgi:hypothetical protein